MNLTPTCRVPLKTRWKNPLRMAVLAEEAVLSSHYVLQRHQLVRGAW